MKDWFIEYGHDPSMDLNYFLNWRPAYRNLIGLIKPLAVEVGVLEGFLSKIALKYVDFGKYFLVDPYKKYLRKDVGGTLHLYTQEYWNEFYNKVKERFKDYPNVELIRKSSVEASKDFVDGSLDFVYIDADHTYQCVWEDINAWYPKIKTGGFISGHDYHDSPDVKSAVMRFFLESDTPEQVKYIGNASQDWWFKKI